MQHECRSVKAHAQSVFFFISKIMLWDMLYRLTKKGRNPYLVIIKCYKKTNEQTKQEHKKQIFKLYLKLTKKKVYIVRER